jgi:hypothetical protein
MKETTEIIDLIKEAQEVLTLAIRSIEADAFLRADEQLKEAIDLIEQAWEGLS